MMSTLIVVGVIGLGAFSLLASRDARSTPVWGALWGAALGLWFLGPLVLRMHHVQDPGAAEWTLVALVLAGAFAVIGLLLAPFGCLPVSLWFLFGRPPRRPQMAYGIAVAALLPLAYAGASGLIEWVSFSRWPTMPRYGQVIGVAVLTAASAATFAWLTGRRLRAALVLVAVAGTIALPIRGGDRSSSVVRGPSSASLPGAEAPGLPSFALRAPEGRRTVPLLVIGLDSGNWRTIKPLVDQGRMPTVKRIIDTGIHGEMDALWPPYWSAPAWGAIVTGYSREEIGIFEDLMAQIQGLPPFEVSLTVDPALDPVMALEFGLMRIGVLRTLPAPRSALRRPPVWELLSRAGVKTGVAHFPFTFPADGQADVVISNRVVTDLWDSLGVRTADITESVAPVSDAPKWQAWFAPAARKDDALLKTMVADVNRRKPADSALDPIEILRKALDTNQRMFDAGENVLREHPDLSVYLHYVAAFDNICHAFWQYRFPEDYPLDPPAREDVDALGPVIDRYLEFLDGRIGRLIAAFPGTPNVILISDHGHAADETSRLWRGWHAPGAIFAAAGPDIPHLAQPVRASYYDVVPTILDLQGLPKPATMRGHTIMPPRTLAPWPPGTSGAPGGVK